MSVPRYFFDIHDGDFIRDDEGTECADFEQVREKVMASLPEMASWIVPSDGDNQAVIVKVRDEEGSQVYTATLSFVGSK